jgi:Histone acetyltransferase subunit NuA4
MPVKPTTDLAVESLGGSAGGHADKERKRDVELVAERSAAKVLTSLSRAVDEATDAVRLADAAVAEAEDKYINLTWTHGNLMRGWEGYCRRVDRAPQHGNGAGTATGAPKQRKVRLSDRMFSMTSSTSALRVESSSADIPLRKGLGVFKKKKKARWFLVFGGIRNIGRHLRFSSRWQPFVCLLFFLFGCFYLLLVEW